MESNSRQQAGKSNTNTLVVTTLVVIVIALGAVFLYPILVPARSGHYHSSSISNIKQLGVSVAIYLSDWDEVHMPVQDQQTFQDCTLPYHKNKRLFTDGGPNVIYNPVFNTHLSAVKTTNIPEPAQTINIHTPSAEETRGPILGYTASYVDTHASTIPASDWPTERQSLDWLFPRETQEFFPIP